jgi:hypothetical protein
MPTQIVWNTKSVFETIQKLRQGANVDLGCFHERNPELKAANILFQLTHEEEQEFIKCSEDIEHFVETYCRFLTDKGRTTVDLRPFQEDILNTLGEENWIDELEDVGPEVRNYILMASRQTGKTTTIAAYFAWYLCFHTDRNLAILANKQATTIEIVGKVMDVFKGLPFFLKPGIVNAGATGMRLDNGCMLTSQATTKTAVLGFAIHVLYIDEFAHIQQKLAREFWRAVYPTLSSSKISQCIISSTPYGQDNLFFELWDKSVKGQNSFVNKRVDYWEVPGHDDEWAEQMKKDFGEDEFAQEFELKFDIKTNNLLTGSQLSWLKRLKDLFPYEHKELEKTELDSELYENLYWRYDFDPNKDYEAKFDRYVISIDIAEGKDPDEKKDSDYNIASVHRIKLKSLAKLRTLRRDEHKIENLFRLEQVGLYRDNVKDEDVLAKVCKSIVFDQFHEDAVKMVVEMNFNGKAFLKEFSNHDKYHDGVVMRSYHTAPVPGEKPPRKKSGFKVRSDKEYYAKLGKKLIGKKTIIPTEEETFFEFNSFGKTPQGKFKGIARHDDTVMAELNLARLYEEPEYGDWLYDYLDELPESDAKKLAMEILKEPYDDSEISDDMFKSLYGEEEKVSEIFELHSAQQFKYRPGTSFGSKN